MWDSPVIEGRRTRPVDPAVKPPRHQLSAPEQAAIEGSPVLRPSVVLGLQRTAGNGAVSALIQRNAALSEEEGDPSLVREIVGKGHGQPLDPALKDEMEGRLGADFSDVRVHTDAAATKSAAAVSARAYTVANEVVFGSDAPDLDSAAGKRVLAHELTHVVQQRQGPVTGTPAGNGISISDPFDTFEQAAEANAERVMSARPEAAQIAGPAGSGAAGDVARAGAVPMVQATSLQLQSADTGTAEDYEQEEEEGAGGAAPEEASTGAGAQLQQPEAEVETAPAAEAAASPTVEVAANQPEAGAAEAAPAADQEMALEQEEEVATESAEDQASEVEVEEDQLTQAEEGVERAEEGLEQEEEQEEEPASV